MASGGKHHNIRKIEKFLDNIRKDPPVLVPKYDEIVILSGSKRRYLKNVKQNIRNIAGDIDFSNVHFWFRKG